MRRADTLEDRLLWTMCLKDYYYEDLFDVTRFTSLRTNQG